MKQSKIIVLVLLIGFFTSNIEAQSFPPAPYVPKTTIKTIRQPQTTVNNYMFTARDKRTLRIFYCMPVNMSTGVKVLFVMHGVNRDADKYIESYRYLSETENIIVIAPEFTLAQFPNADYQRLGISANINKPENWISKIIDDIYLDFAKRFNLPVEKYILYGHSAGAQFTHRALMFSESNYLDYAVAANSGSYTFITMQDINFHYGVKNLLSAHRNLLHKNFNRRLYILTGDRDIDTNDPNLDTAANANRQGKHRHERALNFYQQSKNYCQQNNLPFNWELLVMGGVGHSSANSRSYLIDIVTGRYGR